MNPSPTSLTVPRNLLVLAQVMDRLERSGRPVDPEQFRSVAARLAEELSAVPHDAALDAVLDRFPAVAQIYENLNYQYAGLCRSPLEPGLAAEMAARNAIAAARRHTAPGRATGQG